MSYSFEYSSFTLVKFIPRYYMFFDAIENSIVFLISSSDHSLLVYRIIGPLKK